MVCWQLLCKLIVSVTHINDFLWIGGFYALIENWDKFEVWTVFSKIWLLRLKWKRVMWKKVDWTLLLRNEFLLRWLLTWTKCHWCILLRSKALLESLNKLLRVFELFLHQPIHPLTIQILKQHLRQKSPPRNAYYRSQSLKSFTKIPIQKVLLWKYFQ